MSKTVHYDESGLPDGVPTYLFDHAEAYQKDPLEAGMEWFKESRFGLSLGYGLYSLVGKHEDVRKIDAWTDEDYTHLQKHFSCEGFDAMEIVQLAIAAGARYVVMPARYRDGFCLFHSQQTDFTSVHATANRDFVGEMASVCEYHGVGLCLEYSLGHDWQQFTDGMPAEAEALQKYHEYCLGQVQELLTNYGSLAAIRFEGLEHFQEKADETVSCQEYYDLVHTLQPQCLVSFGKGATGKEDFFAVEEAAPTADPVTEENRFIFEDLSKPLEVRISMTPGSRGYCAEQAGKHLKKDDIWRKFGEAMGQNLQFLIHTALMPDGALDPEDLHTLLDLGEQIEKEGFPKK